MPSGSSPRSHCGPESSGTLWPRRSRYVPADRLVLANTPDTESPPATAAGFPTRTALRLPESGSPVPHPLGSAQSPLSLWEANRVLESNSSRSSFPDHPPAPLPAPALRSGPAQAPRRLSHRVPELGTKPPQLPAGLLRHFQTPLRATRRPPAIVRRSLWSLTGSPNQSLSAKNPAPVSSARSRHMNRTAPTASGPRHPAFPLPT